MSRNGSYNGGVEFSSTLLISVAGGFGVSAICPKRKKKKKDDQTGYYLSASNKCGIKSLRAKECEGRP